MVRWSLPSTSGRDQLMGEFKSLAKDRHGGTVFVTDLRISGLFWPRLQIGASSALTADYDVSLPQVLVDWRALDDLIVALGAWLEQPRPISIELCPAPAKDQSLVRSVGDVAGLITAADKPGCRIRYTGTVFRGGDWAFVVDQSCIRIFYDDLCAARAIIESQER